MESNDLRLKALQISAEAWEDTLYLSKGERLAAAADIYAFELFTLNQLAKVVRLSTTSIWRHYPKQNTVGGRFAPEALPMLVYIRKATLAGDRVSAAHVQAAVDAGCSVGSIAVLTGTPYSTLYGLNQQRKSDG